MNGEKDQGVKMKIYLVGGAIRDKLLGIPVKEKDWVVVGSTPDEMKAKGFKQVGKDFEGGGTFFKKQRVTVQPPKGNVTIHPGSITHKHGARPTTSGARYIIVSFSSFLD